MVLASKRLGELLEVKTAVAPLRTIRPAGVQNSSFVSSLTRSTEAKLRMSDRDAISKVFIPIQRYARTLMGEESRPILKNELLEALGKLAVLESIDRNYRDSLELYLGRTIALIPSSTFSDLQKEIKTTARNALINLHTMG